jgi:hypothetical protein
VIWATAPPATRGTLNSILEYPKIGYTEATIQREVWVPINVTCATCRHGTSVPDGAAGKKGRCRRCGALVTVPHPDQQRPRSEYDLAAPVMAPSKRRPCASAPMAPAGAAAPEVDRRGTLQVIGSPSLRIQLLLAGGLILLGIGGYQHQIYVAARLAAGTLAGGLVAVAVLLLLACSAVTHAYTLSLRHSISRPWNAARRVALILASLWTAIALWMLSVQEVHFQNGSLNTQFVAIIPPVLLLWMIALIPAPERAR